MRRSTARDGTVAPVEARMPTVPAMPDEVLVHLASPLRLVRGERIAGPRDLAAGNHLEAPVRRISMLPRAYEPRPIATDFAALPRPARGAPAYDQDLHLAAQHRWSSTQNREIDMAGVVDSFLLNLDDIEAHWPYLWLGQWVHAGKGTVSGLGGIRLQA